LFAVFTRFEIHHHTLPFLQLHSGELVYQMVHRFYNMLRLSDSFVVVQVIQSSFEQSG